MESKTKDGQTSETLEVDDHFVNANGLRIFTKTWNLPKNETPKAIVFIVHGFCEHCLYYTDLAKAFNQIGCLVVSHDHIGHGHSEGARASVGGPNDESYATDIIDHLSRIRQSYPVLPVFLYSYSMGGSIALITMFRSKEMFRGIILEAPLVAIDPLVLPSYKITMCRLIAYVMPWLPIAQQIDGDLLSRNSDLIERMNSDPLYYHGKINAGVAALANAGMTEITSRYKEITVPLLITHGTDDRVTSPAGSQELFSQCGSTDKTLELFDGCKHAIRFEPDGVSQRFTQLVMDWTAQRI